MRESELHERIRSMWKAGGKRPGVDVGPGDDAAVVRTAGGDALVLTTDQLVEGRHFTADTPVEFIARKAVARSLSDVAAMGGSPRWALASGTLPPDDPRTPELCAQLHRWCEHWSCLCVGGDLASGPGPAVLSVAVIGALKPGEKPLLRSAAKPGQLVGVTGTIGGSLRSGTHLSFEPRVAEARALRDMLGERIGAMIDVSDGLGRDAARIGTASGVLLELDAGRVPRSPGCDDALAACADGEDYELLFTFDGDPPPLELATVIGRVLAASGSSGEPESAPGAMMKRMDGSTVRADAMGWDHE